VEANERISKVIRAKTAILQRANAEGAKDAENDFPNILTAIENASQKGRCHCYWDFENPSPNGEDNPPLHWPHYCDGYKNRVEELIEDSSFSFKCRGGSNPARLIIEW
jgi:hypothetical protein